MSDCVGVWVQSAVGTSRFMSRMTTRFMYQNFPCDNFSLVHSGEISETFSARIHSSPGSEWCRHSDVFVLLVTRRLCTIVGAHHYLLRFLHRNSIGTCCCPAPHSAHLYVRPLGTSNKSLFFANTFRNAFPTEFVLALSVRRSDARQSRAGVLLPGTGTSTSIHVLSESNK